MKKKRKFTANENERKTAKMVSLRTARHPIRRAAARPLTFDLDAQLLALIYKIQQKYLHVTKLTKWQKPKNLMQVKNVEMFLKVPYYAKKKKFILVFYFLNLLHFSGCVISFGNQPFHKGGLTTH